MKRAFDLVMSLLLLILLSPLIILIALSVRIGLGKPVLFSQIRPGLRGEPFTMYKFRSMRLADETDGCTLPDEARITKLGRLLRATSLDELPELFNVLIGDMSLVGPRPLLMEYLPLYSPNQARRHETLPGITGWAQVNGRNELSWFDKFEYDVWYVDHHSLWLDVKILCLTLKKVIAREGINAADGVVVSKFKGND